MVVGGLDGRKHAREHQHVLDGWLLDGVTHVCDGIHHVAPWCTPNMVTVVGNVARFTGVALFALRRAPVAVVLLTALGIYLDNVDGHLARRTDRVTAFGDLLDHGTDWAWGVALAVVYLVVWASPERTWVSVLVLVLLGLYTLQFGVLESLYHRRCPAEAGTGASTAFTKKLASWGTPAALAFGMRPAMGNVVLAAVTLSFIWVCYYPTR